MNIVEVQDNLKNFSQDQLISEINQPSGMVPQFLVLTELGRRNRMKQDIEGRQAQNQPTVAQEVVSAAGVPQGGIMDMARSMAPKSSIEQNDGVEMMAEGGVVKMFEGGIGNISTNINDFSPLEIPLLPVAMNETDNVIQSLAETNEILQDGLSEIERKEQQRKEVELTKFLASQKPRFQGGNVPGGSLPSENQRLIEEAAEMKERLDKQRAESNFMNPDRFNRTPENKLKTAEELFSELGAEKVSVNGEDFFIAPGGAVFNSKGAQIQGGKAMEVMNVAQMGGSDYRYSPIGTFGTYGENPDGSINEEDFTPYGGGNIGDMKTPDPLVNLGQGTKNLINTVTDYVPFIDIPKIVDGTASITDVDNKLTSFSPPTVSNDSVNLMKLNQPEIPDELMIGAFGDIVRPDELQMPEFNNTPRPPFLPSGSEDMPDELMVPFDNTPSKGKGGDDGGDGNDDDKGGGTKGGGTKGGSALGSLESEIANMLKQNEDQQEKDKYLSLAKAGLALMSSSQPTFGGALGEAGLAGVEDLQASRKAYRDDKITLLDAQRKLEQARSTAAAKDKSGLTGTNIVSTLNNIRNQKSKIMTKLAEITPAIDGGELTEAQKNQAEMLKREIANLTVMESTYAGMLGGIGSLGATGTFDATEE